MAVPSEFIQDLRQRVPLSDVVGRRVKLIRKGRRHRTTKRSIGQGHGAGHGLFEKQLRWPDGFFGCQSGGQDSPDGKKLISLFMMPNNLVIHCGFKSL